MAHGPHRHVDIAHQAGLSLATVDRVLHGRPGASARAERAVARAVEELDRQHMQVRLGVSALSIDLVMQAPRRFSAAMRAAVEAALPTVRPATVRARFHLRESGTAHDIVAVLDRLGRRRPCDGVLLKAPDEQRVADAVNRLVARDIPVVTLVTDVQGCQRSAYVGLDNAAAGATAAYLVRLALRDERGYVLTTVSHTAFQGERERLQSFVDALGRLDAGREIITLTDAEGLDASTAAVVRHLLIDRPEVAAVYSIGGANAALAGECANRGIVPRIHLGHDLDTDNIELLSSGRLSAVLHHDLRSDARWAITQLLRSRGVLPGKPSSRLAVPQVVTPHNVPLR